MNYYSVLDKQIFTVGNFSLVPIRSSDKFVIMKWRNEQMYHLRQDSVLTIEKQNNYFKNIVSTLFDNERPSQILFSFLKNGECIGYGGLVHINWVDMNAEISFIMDTALEKEHFNEYWSIYLKCLEELAFDEIKFHKIYVYAFDLRPHLYEMLVDNDYFLDARLTKHCLYDENLIDVVIHSKLKTL